MLTIDLAAGSEPVGAENHVTAAAPNETAGAAFIIIGRADDEVVIAVSVEVAGV